MMTTSVYPLPFEKGWKVRPCVNHLGHVTSLDIGPPTEPGARGGPVIASVYSGEAVANLMSAAPELLESLENAVSALEGFKISPIGGLDKMRRDIEKARGTLPQWS
jgi:hypothetical protein